MELSTLFFFERHGELNRDQKKYRLSAEYNYNISIRYAHSLNFEFNIKLINIEKQIVHYYCLLL